MARTSTNSKSTSTPVEKVEDITKEVADYKNEIEELRNQNKSLSDQVKELIEMFNSLKATDEIIHGNKNVKSDEIEDDGPEIPATSKQIRIMSLCYGPLILDDGRGRSFKLDKYGDIVPVLYSNLIDIVNQNRSFAEKGYFYILDKGAVYHLGLDSIYKNLLTKDIIDNILTFNDVDIRGMISTANNEQKELIVKTISDKIYNYGSSNVDLNKVELIEKLCDRSIMNKVKEMQERSYLSE